MHKFNYSDEDKKRIIEKAYSQGLDILVFLENNFNRHQMMELYYGLVAGVDVSKYANNNIPSDGMRYIREGLELGLDVTKFNNPIFTSGKMNAIRDSLLSNTFLDVYTDENVDENIIKTAMKMVSTGIDKDFVEFLLKEGKYSTNQINRIRLINMEFGDKFNEIFKKYQTLPEKYYQMLARIYRSNPKIDAERLMEMFQKYWDMGRPSSICIGEVEEKLVNRANLEDCEKYIDGKITIESIKTDMDNRPSLDEFLEDYEIERELGKGFVASHDEEYINALRQAYELELSLKKLVEKDFSSEQIEEICYSVEDNCSILNLVDNSVTPLEMYQLRNLKNFENKVGEFAKRTHIKKDKILSRVNASYNKDTRRFELILVDSSKSIVQSLYMEELIRKTNQLLPCIKDDLSDEEIIVCLGD